MSPREGVEVVFFSKKQSCPGEKELKLFFFPKEQSCSQGEQAFSSLNTWLFLGAT
jgi:hypothetical protein